MKQKNTEENARKEKKKKKDISWGGEKRKPKEHKFNGT